MPMTQHYFDVCTAHGTGDPHYRAVTGRRFDFHGDGEFLLLEIGPERLDDGDEQCHFNV